MQKLALGTVQFGLPYGIANMVGKTPTAEARIILARAQGVGIDTLDTAVGYGESEHVLGQVGVEGFRVVSKLPSLPDDTFDVAAWVMNQLQGSLERLRLDRLEGLLLHQPAQLLQAKGDQLYAALQKLKSEGWVDKIGISIYEPAELESLIPKYEFDLIQTPLNALDRRIIESGWAKRLTESGVEIHARSCFLQGLLLMAPEDRPAKFNRFASLWQSWDHWLKIVNLTPLQACLRFALSQPDIERVVIGVDSAAQLAEIVSAAEGGLPEFPCWPISPDPLLINPSCWSAL